LRAFMEVLPLSLRQTALHDPDLCWSGTVSLDGWFSHRRGGFSGLALHEDPASGIYVVSGHDGSPEQPARQPIVAFRRDLGPRWRFDLPSIVWAIGLATILLLVGLAIGWRERGMESHRSARLLRWQVRWLVMAAAVPCLTAGYRLAADLPRPGHEWRSHYTCGR
jgi:hypothetical protein